MANKTPWATIEEALEYTRSVGGSVEMNTGVSATVKVAKNRYDLIVHQGHVYQRDHVVPPMADRIFAPGHWVAGPWLWTEAHPDFSNDKALLEGTYHSHQTHEGFVHEFLTTAEGETYWRVMSPPVTIVQ